MCHVRDSVNPLAADDHLKEVIQQLQLMGEVVYVKAELSDLVILEPNWLTKSVLGHLLSPEFVSKSRVTGAYSPTDFQFAAPEWDALEMLPVLEALAVCAQCQCDGAIEYEFPCFNVLSADPDSLWPRDVGAEFGRLTVYGGVMLKARWVTLHKVWSRVESTRVRFSNSFTTLLAKKNLGKGCVSRGFNDATFGNVFLVSLLSNLVLNLTRVE